MYAVSESNVKLRAQQHGGLESSMLTHSSHSKAKTSDATSSETTEVKCIQRSFFGWFRSLQQARSRTRMIKEQVFVACQTISMTLCTSARMHWLPAICMPPLYAIHMLAQNDCHPFSAMWRFWEVDGDGWVGTDLVGWKKGHLDKHWLGSWGRSIMQEKPTQQTRPLK